MCIAYAAPLPEAELSRADQAPPGQATVPRGRRRRHRSRATSARSCAAATAPAWTVCCSRATARCTSRRPSPRRRPGRSSTCRSPSSAGSRPRSSRLRDAGIWVVGLDDAADRSLFDIGELAAEGICLVLGAEGAGLSRLVRERCDVVVSIPMRGRVSSLNVSAAAALADLRDRPPSGVSGSHRTPPRPPSWGPAAGISDRRATFRHVARSAQTAALRDLVRSRGLTGLESPGKILPSRPPASPKPRAVVQDGDESTLTCCAGLAQLAEHLICNHEVVGSIPTPGSHHQDRGDEQLGSTWSYPDITALGRRRGRTRPRATRRHRRTSGGTTTTPTARADHGCRV